MKKLFLAVAVMLALSLEMSSADADNLDAYRQMLASGSYTIRYENVTPTRITNRDRMELFGSSGLAVERNAYLINKSLRGLIVADGGKKYEQVGDGEFDMCRLTRGTENYLFTCRTKGDRVKYYGENRNKVSANSRNYLAELINGESYGDADMTRLLNAMLPDNVKSADMPRYEFVASGQLENGAAYEDYKSTDGGMMSAIRYYFDGDRLIKIASADYRKDSDGRIEGQRCVIEIKEFSPNADDAYLKLPSELKDVTARRKGA